MRGSSGRTASDARVDTKTSSDAAALPEAVAGLVGAAVLFGAGDDFQSGIAGPTSMHHVFRSVLHTGNCGSESRQHWKILSSKTLLQLIKALQDFIIGVG